MFCRALPGESLCFGFPARGKTPQRAVLRRVTERGMGRKEGERRMISFT